VSGIVVSVKPPSDAGRLYPRYDEESGILALESRVKRAWPFGIDVDGALVFDLDDQRILANFDLHVPMNRWKRDLEENTPRIAPAADLEFAQQTVAQKSFHLPLRLSCDSKAKRLRIELGTAKPDRAVALSASCIALLANHELVGFLIDGIA
jgi:hypothetical protein